jgi:hypothetical protein
MTQKPKDIYIFGLENELIKVSDGPHIAKELKIRLATVYMNAWRKSLWNSRYYFSYERNFKIPEKSIHSNPLQSKTGKHQKDWNNQLDKYFRNRKTDEED